MHKAERGKLGTESASHTWHKITIRQKYHTLLIRPSAVQAEKENLGEAQAYCSVPEA
jgi:hypothetical protein